MREITVVVIQPLNAIEPSRPGVERFVSIVIGSKATKVEIVRLALQPRNRCGVEDSLHGRKAPVRARRSLGIQKPDPGAYLQIPSRSYSESRRIVCVLQAIV